MPDTATSTAAPAPVMDVVAPPPEKTDKKPDPAEPEADPVDELAAQDQREQAAQHAEAEKAKTKEVAPHQQAHSKPAERSGVGLAISATVVIVLGLAILATYAYIQTNK